MNLKVKKMIGIIIGFIILAFVVQIACVLGIEYYQQSKNHKLLSSFKINKQLANTLVVYFSRSGATQLMAYKIAEIKYANILNIEANNYEIGLRGWISAMLDARKTKASIGSGKVDLSSFDTIYIGSPIWLYSPAPPIFEFIRNNDFTGKKVTLFNSLNSKFDQKCIDEFSHLVSSKGGHLTRHIYVIRGRMTGQLETDAFLNSVESKLLNRRLILDRGIKAHALDKCIDTNCIWKDCKNCN